MPVLTRRIEIDGQEFTVYGNAPWTTIPVAATKNKPACTIIIEGSNVESLLRSGIDPHRANALYRGNPQGKLLPVAFTGESGRAAATRILLQINDKLDR